MPVAEQAGRAFAELTIEDFDEYYAEGHTLAEEQSTPQAGQNAPPGFTKRPPLLPSGKSHRNKETHHSRFVQQALKMSKSLKDGLEDGSFRSTFDKEVATLRARYESLALWLQMLLDSKREAAY